MRHGSKLDPPNRFAEYQTEADLEHVEWDVEYLKARADRAVQYHSDQSQSILTKIDSPDIPFMYSINPYRGCAHGCSYCYARNSHEYLGLNAGLDFETQIFVKHHASELLRKVLTKKSWQPEPISFSGVTDCYQPAEREYRLTRACLQVISEFRQPASVITKNALVLRDLDILQPLAAANLFHANISLTTLDPELARLMEPRTSIPAARLRAIQTMTDAGVSVRVMMAPVIPGLNDHEMADIMQAAKDHGAKDCGYVLLRLPLTVRPVFQEWLQRAVPTRAEKVEQRIRQTRDGRLNDSQWGTRMRGTGLIAEQIRSMYQLQRRRLKFSDLPPLDRNQFQRPRPNDGQLLLFD
ncbi:MAG: PA0069 family radical SAM protein [Fuerstiella sp.]